MFSEGTAALAHHSVLTYLFARAIGEARGVRPGGGYDDELLFLACVLHDAGLIERGNGGQRFEVDGADLAAGFLRENGMDEARVQVAWEAIALHSSQGIAHRMRPEIALTHAGTAADITGQGARNLPGDLTGRVHAAFPRLEGGHGITEIIVGQIDRNPAKAPMGSFPAEIARQYGTGTPPPEWAGLLAAAWPGVG